MHGERRFWVPVLFALLLFGTKWAGGRGGGAEWLVTVLGSLGVLIALKSQQESTWSVLRSSVRL